MSVKIDSDNAITSLTKSTLIPLGLVITIVLSVSGGFVWLNAELLSIKHQLQTVVDDLAEMKILQQHASDGKTTVDQFRAWARLLKAQNPELDVPIPGD